MLPLQFYIIADDLYNTRKGSNSRQLRHIQQIVVHPAYKMDIMPHFDIAVLRLSLAFQLTPTLAPIGRHLQYEGRDAAEQCLLAGWNVGLVSNTYKQNILVLGHMSNVFNIIQHRTALVLRDYKS